MRTGNGAALGVAQAPPVSDESVRINALNAALNITGRTNAATTVAEVLAAAEEIASWIRDGKDGT